MDANYELLSEMSGYNRRSIVAMTPGERKKFMSGLIEELAKYNDIYKALNKRSSSFNALINSINNKISHISLNETQLDQAIANTEMNIATYEASKSMLEEKLHKERMTTSEIEENENKKRKVKELEDKILQCGEILPGDILKVGSFLNQRIDVGLLRSMAKEVKNHFTQPVDKILTIEASGLPLATAVSLEYQKDMVFAKKAKTANTSGNIISAQVASYTHHNTVEIITNKEYFNPGDRVLIVDDFLAYGNAIKALMDLVRQAGAVVVGAAVSIEKEYQNGGNELRTEGYDVFSLAKIAFMDDKSIRFDE
jgi:xanthine phosphoribosyltransferase